MIRLLTLSLLSLWFISLPLHATKYEFSETINNKTTTNWMTTEQDGETIIIKGDTRFDHIELHCNPDLSTQKWIYIEPNKTNITAIRTGNVIHIKGTLLNEPFDSTIKIDDHPWIQLPSMQLPPFSQSSKRKLSYWILAPDTMEATLLIAQKQGLTDIDIQDINYPALHIKITPPGLKSFFWEAHYWFRQTDGQFLEFKGPRGGRGAPKSHIHALFSTQ